MLARSCLGDELGASGGTVTDLTVPDGLVGHGVLSDVVSNHVSFDFNFGPVLATVDCGNGADHLGHDDGITKVGLDGLWLLTKLRVLGGVLELLGQLAVALGDTVLESAALASLEHGDNLSGIHFEQLVELDTSVNLLSERFFFACIGLSGCLGCCNFLGCCGHPVM